MLNKITLEFEGTSEDFERALCEKDEEFELIDSILWEKDYGGEGSVHKTKYGDITIHSVENGG